MKEWRIKIETKGNNENNFIIQYREACYTPFSFFSLFSWLIDNDDTIKEEYKWKNHSSKNTLKDADNFINEMRRSEYNSTTIKTEYRY